MHTMSVLAGLFETLEADNKNLEARLLTEGVIADLEHSIFRGTALALSDELEKVIRGEPSDARA